MLVADDHLLIRLGLRAVLAQDPALEPARGDVRPEKALGVIPANCDLTERSAGIPVWDAIAPELQPVLARQMEIYAGYLENSDHHVVVPRVDVLLVQMLKLGRESSR